MVGEEQIQSKCMLCGTTRIIGRTNWGDFQQIDFIIQYREMPGGKVKGTGRGYRGSARGGGFKIIPDKCLRLDEINKDSEYFKEIQKMAKGVIRTAKILQQYGFIKEGEI